MLEILEYVKITVQTQVKTREEVIAAFAARGVCVSEWAKQHGFRRENVYSVLAGRTRGRRGEAHAVAIALGLKAGLVEDEEVAPPHDVTQQGK